MRPICVPERRAAQLIRCISRTTKKCRSRLLTKSLQEHRDGKLRNRSRGFSGQTGSDPWETYIDGEREIREKQAARERGNDRAYRSREDDTDGVYHQSAGEAQSEGEISIV